MPSHWLQDQLSDHGDAVVITGYGGTYSYPQLIEEIASLTVHLEATGVTAGSVVCFVADFSIQAYAALLSIAALKGIAVPISPSEGHAQDLASITGATHTLDQTGNSTKLEQEVRRNILVDRLAQEESPGLVIFTSGSTGEPKAALHNFNKFTEKYRKPTSSLVAVAVSPMDHIAGLDTLFYGLTSGGTVVRVRSQAADDVLAAIEEYGVDILPVTPTFLRLMIISGAIEKRKLSSLKLIAYGAEVMPPQLLETITEALPDVKFIQKFGMTEIGSPATRSPKETSTWIRLDPDSIESKVVDGILWVRTESTMLGYLNAPSPIDSDQWLNTGDLVEQTGDYIKILGRESDMINVGGHKVNPYQIENVILAAPGVTSVVVRGESNPLMGQIPVAYVESNLRESDTELSQRIRLWCSERVNRWQVPAKIVQGSTELIPGRVKVDRSEPKS